MTKKLLSSNKHEIKLISVISLNSQKSKIDNTMKKYIITLIAIAVLIAFSILHNNAKRNQAVP
jgi:hypothetical protein